MYSTGIWIEPMKFEQSHDMTKPYVILTARASQCLKEEKVIWAVLQGSIGVPEGGGKGVAT